MSGNNRGTSRTKPQITRLKDGDGGSNAKLFDQFGILRSDERSKSSDSVPMEDPSFLLTDDDTSVQILDANTASENELAQDSKFYQQNRGTASDSEPVHDSSNAHLSDFHVQLEDLTADHTGASEDFSRASDGAHTSRVATGSAPASQHQDETESLTEFEEIERLIKANTAEDSDDDLSDIPEDLEQRVLSGRKSRESTRSGRKSEERTSPTSARSPPVSDADNHSSHHQDEGCELKATTAHQDTGYASGGDRSTVNILQEDESNLYAPTGGVAELPINDAEHEDQYSTVEDVQHDGPAQDLILQETLHSSGQFTTHPELNDLHIRQSSSSPSSDENGNTGTIGNGLDEALDHFLVPTQRTDTNQPSSLVATFGTTEDFEVLLKQQLENMSADEVLETSGRLEKSSSGRSLERERGSGDKAKTSTTRKKKLPEEPSTKFGSRSSSRSRSSRRGSPTRGGTRVKPTPRSKLHLTTTNKKSPRDFSSSTNPDSGRPASRSSRSPAGNRTQRGRNNGRSSATLYRESSDDMSARSDLSRSELRSRLREEAQIRKREEDMVKELQSNYGALLMKYAQAENTIDHLRVGAKINLSVAVPRTNPEDPTLPFEEAQLTRQERNPSEQDPRFSQDPYTANERISPTMRASTASSPFHYRSPSAGSLGTSGSKPDNMVEGSLQLPSAASAEFLRVALQLQAKDLQDRIASFHTLLQEDLLSPDEQQQALEKIEECLRNLERDYLHAIDEHAAEQRKLRHSTGGSVDPGQEFDPERAIESDIGRLGMMVSDVRDAVANRNRTRDPVSARSNQVECDGTNSPEGNVDDKFNQLLHKYNRPVPTDEDRTAAPSLNLSSAEEDSFSPRQIPNWYFQPSNDPNASTASQTQSSPTALPSPLPRSSRRQRYQSSFSSMGESAPSTSPSPTRKQHSRLPRPTTKGGAKERRTPSSEERKSQQTDKGTDSGFVGSESSRQSKPDSAPHPTKVKLVSRPPTTVDARTEPGPNEKRSRHHSGDTTTTMASSLRRSPKAQSYRPPASPGYMDRVGIYKPSPTHDDTIDDVSTTSTVRDMLRPRHTPRSYSTSTAASQATTVKQKSPSSAYPRGSKTGASVKSRDSGRRSVASSTRDSTLDVIRGEISRLRDEIKAAKTDEKENFRPTHVSTPRAPPAHVDGPPILSDSDTLRAIRSDIRALKDEVQRRGPKNDDTDRTSVRSVEPSTGRSRDNDRGRRSRRSRSLGRDDLSEIGSRRNDSSPETRRRRGRSRSQNRDPWQGGYWTYVPPPPYMAPMWGTTPPSMGRAYTRTGSPVPVVNVATNPQVVHAPIIGPPSNVVYVDHPTVTQTPAVGRVYVPTSSQHARLYTTPSKPKASIYISPKSSARQGVRKASVYIVDSESEDEPLRRSHLKLRRSSSMSKLNNRNVTSSAFVVMPDSRLNDSLGRAERSAENLRNRSRVMYRTLRDDLYRTQLLADTM